MVEMGAEPQTEEDTLMDLLADIMSQLYRENDFIGDPEMRREYLRCRWCERIKPEHHANCPVPKWEARYTNSSTPISTLSPPLTTAVTVPTIVALLAKAFSSDGQSLGCSTLPRVSL